VPDRKTKKPRTAAQLAYDARQRAHRAQPASAIEGADERADPLAALMADPAMAARLAALIDVAVQARLGSAGQTSNTTSEMGELAKTFGKMLEIQAMQMPGYYKPLPQEEVEKRLAGKVEFFALLERFKAAGTPPRYYVGPGKFYAGAVQHEDGMPIDTYLPPPEDFLPCYEGPGGQAAGERAEQVMRAQMQWLGGPSPDIATRVSEAEAEAHARAIPLVGNEPPGPKPSPVQLVPGVKVREANVRPAFAAMGETVVPGMGAATLAQGRGAPARGPAFVE
jgi:hypothetical protein